VKGLATGHKARASGDLALHVLEIMEGILQAARTGKAVMIPQGAQPEALSEEQAAALRI
jgi:hypothetical protein